MRGWLLVLTLATVASCHTTQPGCTLENCRTMVEACRVEFSGVSSFCYTNTTVPPGTDFAPWCVQACDAHQGNGKLAECIAGKANECRGARDAGTTPQQVIEPCFDPTAKGPVMSCDDQCTATRTICDDQCTGGRPCDSCRRGGGPNCAELCPDAGFAACADCSIQCALRYIACSDSCPRQ